MIPIVRRGNLPSIEKRLAPLLAEYPLGDRYLVGVSGGRDSVTLLHLLLQHGFADLLVCHLDHGLRADSGADAEFVQKLAEMHALEYELRTENVADRASVRHQSIETTARDARYEFFAEVAQRRGCSTVFLAHHADDQVETFLLNLFRGAGSNGLAGMAVRSLRLFGSVNLLILRPLLSTWRSEIEAYVAAHRLPFREDPSNSECEHTRNRLRHQLIPVIEKAFGRDVRSAIWRAADVLRAENDFLRSQIPAGVASELSLKTTRTAPEALQRRLIAAWLKGQHVTNVGFREVEAVRGLLESRCAKVNLPGGVHARRRAGKLFLERSSPASSAASAAPARPPQSDQPVQLGSLGRSREVRKRPCH